MLEPASSWESKPAYEDLYGQLASRFIENFKKFAEGCPPDVLKGGPVRPVR